MQAENKNIRIIDIANLAEVSVGTVDRVLHNRGKVSQDKRERVEKVLKEIDYRPNLIARSLASRRHYKILALMPSFEPGQYWENICSGIARAAGEFVNFNITLEYVYFDQYDVHSFIKASKSLSGKEFEGLLVPTLFEDAVIDLSKTMDEREIPYVFIDSNILNQNNLAYFGVNSIDSGMIAARLMLSEIGLDSDIIISHIQTPKNIISTQIRNREKGFREYLTKNNYKGQIHLIDFVQYDYTKGLRQFCDILSERELVGCVVFNSRIFELVNILTPKAHLAYKMRLIGYDAIENNIHALETGKVSYLISQHANVQGYNAVKCLSNFLLEGKRHTQLNYLPIDILIKENVGYYNNYKL